MDFTHEIQLAFRHYWRAFRFIEKKNLWTFLILPALLNLLIALIISFFAIKSSGQLVALFMKNLHFASSNNGFHRFLESVILLILRGMVLFMYLKIYRYLVLILVAPILAFISEKVQSLDLGIEEHIQPKQYFNEFTRGMRIAIRNFFFEILFTVLILFVTFLITWLVPLAPILILIVESYYMGYAMMDYRNEFLKMSAKESRKIGESTFGTYHWQWIIFESQPVNPTYWYFICTGFCTDSRRVISKLC